MMGFKPNPYNSNEITVAYKGSANLNDVEICTGNRVSYNARCRLHETAQLSAYLSRLRCQTKRDP